MANLDAPLGFRAVSNGVAGSVPRISPYLVAASTTVYEGDVVALNASGLIIAYTTTDAIAGDLIGVAAHKAAAAEEVLVYDDPAQEFEAQQDAADLTTLADYQFLNFGLVKTTGNTTTLQSKHEIDGGTGLSAFGTNASTVRPVQIVRKSQSINNEIGASVSWTKFVVRINPAAHLSGTGGILRGGGIGT